MQNKRVRRNRRVKKTKRFEFSKFIIIQESLLVWIITFKLLGLATESIAHDFVGTLPYLTTLCGAIWTAYGASVGFYYNKAKAENLNKNKVENVIQDYEDMSKLKELEGL